MILIMLISATILYLFKKINISNGYIKEIIDDYLYLA